MSTVSSVSPRRPSPVVSPAPPQIARWGLLVLLVGAFVFMCQNVFFWAYGINLAGGLETHGYAWRDGDWSHALIVPLISLYFLYQHRRELLAMPIYRSWVGFAVMLIGIGCYFPSIWPIRNAAMDGSSREVGSSVCWVTWKNRTCAPQPRTTS